MYLSKIICRSKTQNQELIKKLYIGNEERGEDMKWIIKMMIAGIKEDPAANLIAPAATALLVSLSVQLLKTLL